VVESKSKKRRLGFCTQIVVHNFIYYPSKGSTKGTTKEQQQERQRQEGPWVGKTCPDLVPSRGGGCSWFLLYVIYMWFNYYDFFIMDTTRISPLWDDSFLFYFIFFIHLFIFIKIIIL